MEDACRWREVQNSAVYQGTTRPPQSRSSDDIRVPSGLRKVLRRQVRSKSACGAGGVTLSYGRLAEEGIMGMDPGRGAFFRLLLPYDVCAPTVSNATGYRTMPPIPSRAPGRRGSAMNASSGHGKGAEIPDSFAAVKPKRG